MLLLSFEAPRDVISIRDDIHEVCSNVAEDFGLVARFEQPQQVVFKWLSDGRKSNIRIGNGKHKSWRVDYQKEPSSTPINRVKRVSQLFIRSPFLPAQMQFGGFSYDSETPGEWPVYPYVTIHTPSELKIKNYSHEHDCWMPLDPNPDLLKLTYESLANHFGLNHPTLFDIETSLPLPQR